jgi:hypothetical protein
MHYEHPKDGGVYRTMRRIDALLIMAFAVICLLPGSADYRTTVEQVIHENETGYLPH